MLGEKSGWVCGLIMQISFFGTGVAYIITSATCLRAIQRSNCYHKHGRDAPCEFEDANATFMLLFGVVQIFMSQIPDFHSMDWLSILAAIMSFAYSSIGLGLGVVQIIGNGVFEGSIGGISASSSTQKFWLVSQALGDIGFAYPFCIIILNIQMYCQPVYAMVDKWFDELHSDSTFVNRKYSIKLPLLPSLRLNLQRLCSRTAYVASTTAVAMMFPYFNEVLGVLGAINFWPLAIYFPVEMCLRRKNIQAWTNHWILLRTFSIVCFVLTMFAFVASIEGIIAARLKIHHA